jgi:ankyrin repeat protein
MDLDDIPYVEGMAISCMPPAAEYFDDPMWYDSGGRDPLKQREIFKLEAGEERTRRLKGIVKEYRLYGPMLYELAAEVGRVDIIRLLLELGANPNLDRSNAESDDDADSTASADEGEDQEKSKICTPDADIDEAAGDEKQSANGEIEASDGDDDAIKSDEGSTQDQDEADDQSMNSGMSDSDESDRTPMLTLHPPLTGAAFAGQLESVKVLLDEVKVAIDEYDQNGPSIGYAASAGHADVVKFLLSRGAAIVTKPDSPDILALALKSGSMTTVNAIFESEQWKTSGHEVTITHLPFAGHGGNHQAVELVLSLCGLPPPNGDIGDLTDVQSDKILDTLTEATAKGSLACLHSLLPYVTRQQPDGSYAYFQGRDHFEIAFLNATEDAIDIADNPDLFQLAWTTVILRPNTGPQDLMARTPFDANGKPNITNYEALHRLLIAAAGHGRLETVKVMCEKYDVNVNHVSHKFFSTPLSRAAGQGLYDLQARLGVARYLLEHTSVDPSIAHGDFANGTTPLACAMSQRQTEMIRLLLEFGGPVESIDDDVLRDVERREPGEQVELCVAYLYQRPRREVRIMSEEACEKAAEEERVDHAMLGWERDELLSMLGRMKIRASNEELQKADPKGRPLAEAV